MFLLNLLSTLVIKYSTIIMSISQISETLFILAIPFFLKRFGIKQCLFQCLLGYCVLDCLLGNPGDGLWMIIVCVVYGMAFDFLIFQVHYLLKLLPTLEYVLAHRGVYDDVKRIWRLLWWDFQRNSY
jgi:hypothetical protein